MKTGIALLIIFFFCVGWKLYSDHKATEAQHWSEIQAGYDACVEPLNANLGRGPVDQATFDAMMKAKEDARSLVCSERAMKCLSVVAIIALPVMVNLFR